MTAALSYYRHTFHPANHDPALQALQARVRSAPIPVPALAFHGTKDRPGRLEAFETMDDLFAQGVAKVILLGTGHFLHLERPEEVNQRIVAFLQAGQPAKGEDKRAQSFRCPPGCAILSRVQDAMQVRIGWRSRERKVHMSPALRWTSADLVVLPDDGKRYEIINGELYMSRQPHWHHQRACVKILAALEAWSVQTGAGEANLAPGVIFAEDDDVAPDVVWISHARRATALGADGHLHAAPELVVEVLSPGATNEGRDREAKLKLYSRRGVLEYWIVDWRVQQVEVYRREDLVLRLVATLYRADTLTSPLLPNFTCEVATLF